MTHLKTNPIKVRFKSHQKHYHQLNLIMSWKIPKMTLLFPPWLEIRPLKIIDPLWWSPLRKCPWLRLVIRLFKIDTRFKSSNLLFPWSKRSWFWLRDGRERPIIEPQHAYCRLRLSHKNCNSKFKNLRRKLTIQGVKLNHFDRRTRNSFANSKKGTQMNKHEPMRK